MGFSEKYARIFKYILPTPFTIAILLTIATFFIAYFITQPDIENPSNHAIQLMKYWESGLWNTNLLVFAMQMMLMLVIGHTLALTQPVNNLISKSVQFCNSTSKAASLVTFLTIIVSLFNWGLGLIFGAIFARKVGEHALKKNIQINYPIIGAAGYSGLMVWHGGLSGSSLTKVAEPGHLKKMMKGLITDDQISQLPEKIAYSETVWSSMNLTVMLLILILLPLTMYWLGKKSSLNDFELNIQNNTEDLKVKELKGVEKLDHSKVFSVLFGSIILCYIIRKIIIEHQFNLADFFTPNNINLLLLALTIIMHKSFFDFLKSVNQAISGASGILIQFPLYFGIMGIMTGSGMVDLLSDFFVQISNATTYPIFTFISAGIVNIFVPSGGGQWAVQGPIIIQAASDLGISLPKSIMALAYGDQLTNMLQPFWALPLLGITGLKAKEILPYSLFLMMVGGVIYFGCLLIF